MRVDFLCKERSFFVWYDANIVPVYGCFSIYFFVYSSAQDLFALSSRSFYSREMRLRCLSRRCESSSRAFKSSLSISL